MSLACATRTAGLGPARQDAGPMVVTRSSAEVAQDRHLASARGMVILPMIPRTRVARVKIVSETVLMYAYCVPGRCRNG